MVVNVVEAVTRTRAPCVVICHSSPYRPTRAAADIGYVVAGAPTECRYTRCHMRGATPVFAPCYDAIRPLGANSAAIRALQRPQYSPPLSAPACRILLII